MRIFRLTSIEAIFFNLLLTCLFLLINTPVSADELDNIRERGVLRHLGIPYAHFVRNSDKGLDGLDVELMRMFAKYLGVNYEWVETSWSSLFGDLTGEALNLSTEGRPVVTGKNEIRGDIIANGLTVLDWRKQVVMYSTPTFPTGVWLIARASSPIKPIIPSGDVQIDIRNVKSLLAGHSVLAAKGTCLDPDLYDLVATKADIQLYTASENLNEIAPAIINGAAEATLLDIPNALVALQQWPGEIKIIGPISEPQLMGVAVAKTSPVLLAEFNLFFQNLVTSGIYDSLVHKYYPSVYLYHEDFFKRSKGK